MNLSRPDRSARLDALAAEYVLGTLPARARRRLGGLARQDPVIARAIAAWEARLGALTEAIPGVTPPPRVWDSIRTRLGLAAPEARTRRAPRVGWWANLRLWQGIAVASFAVAFALAVSLLSPKPEIPAQAIVVVLAGPDAKPVLVASADRGARYLTIKSLAPVDVATGRALELWALPEGRDPQSLGLIPAAGIGRVSLPVPADAAFRNVPALAVSLEPAGGSPTGKPTGPVLYTGGIQRMY